MSSAEVKQVFFSIKENKIFWSEGYGSVFFREVWEIIGDDMIDVVKVFFDLGRMFRQVNVIQLFLIVKIDISKNAGDFRLIVCCNVICKVIFKIICNKLRDVLLFLVV